MHHKFSQAVTTLPVIETQLDETAEELWYMKLHTSC